MSGQNSTHFQFCFGGIELEIAGEREFVERMYRKIMVDIETARKAPLPEQAAAAAGVDSTKVSVEKRSPVLWVHKCNEMMHKIYMSSPREMKKAPILRAIDTNAVNVMYIDRSVSDSNLPRLEKGQTLWAELTEEGKKRIAQAGPGSSKP